MEDNKGCQASFLKYKLRRVRDAKFFFDQENFKRTSQYHSKTCLDVCILETWSELFFITKGLALGSGFKVMCLITYGLSTSSAETESERETCKLKSTGLVLMGFQGYSNSQYWFNCCHALSK